MNSGDVFDVEYPFVRCVAANWDTEGVDYYLSWRPGIDYYLLGPYGENSQPFANGIGEMRLTVVSTHKPGRYPERVFYTRKWTDPDGKTFGKGRLLIATRQKFKSLCRGYSVGFELEPNTDTDEVERFKKERAAA